MSEESFKTKTVFTTGEAAHVCYVSQQTILRCFDSGQLKGFRVPGSRFRRIPRENLLRFIKENGIPLHRIQPRKDALIFAKGDLATALTGIFAETHDVLCETDSVCFGMKLETLEDPTVVIDCRTDKGRSLAASVARLIKSSAKYAGLDLIRLLASAEVLENAVEAEEDHIIRIRPDEKPDEIAARVAQKAAA